MAEALMHLSHTSVLHFDFSDPRSNGSLPLAGGLRSVVYLGFPMFHSKSNSPFHLLSVSLCLPLLIYLSLLTDPTAKPLERVENLLSCLTSISVLTKSLTKESKVLD